MDTGHIFIICSYVYLNHKKPLNWTVIQIYMHIYGMVSVECMVTLVLINCKKNLIVSIWPVLIALLVLNLK